MSVSKSRSGSQILARLNDRSKSSFAYRTKRYRSNRFSMFIRNVSRRFKAQSVYSFSFVPVVGRHYVFLHFREKTQRITHVRLLIFCWSSCRDSSDPGLEPCRAKRLSSSRMWLSGTGTAWSLAAMLSQRSSRKTIFSEMLIAAICGISFTFILMILHPIEKFHWGTGMLYRFSIIPQIRRLT